MASSSPPPLVHQARAERLKEKVRYGMCPPFVGLMLGLGLPPAAVSLSTHMSLLVYKSTAVGSVSSKNIEYKTFNSHGPKKKWGNSSSIHTYSTVPPQ